jgi:hypothetical protein
MGDLHTLAKFDFTKTSKIITTENDEEMEEVINDIVRY